MVVNYFNVEDENIADSIEKFSPSLIWIESPSNPNLLVADIQQLAKISRSINSIFVVDNTFMTPYLQV